ncbi:uncharacterized protein LOC126907580 [Daktulosphaira vitifoliae]|uniref:uncharacterized protein LOC126907580 n=1 Tax=Daktulosphaira vitifoliae TaxID=58002 RepID=UPI0021AAB07E|nr:uncharacterized protein LOC126907580 [Daktulosphaira vitifoliae]
MFFVILKTSALLLLLSNAAFSLSPRNVICSVVSPNSKKGPVTFYLNTKNIKHFEIKADADSIKNAPFTDRSDTLKIVIHGFGSNPQEKNIEVLRNAYLNGTIDRNVLMVDYSPTIGNVSDAVMVEYQIDYVKAVRCALPVAAKAIANMAEMTLNTIPGIKKIHLIGHSLGGQISGEVGTLMQKKGKIIDRISALDPAEPLFKLGPKLSPQSAGFVDVYHTNIANKGYTTTLGTVDYYINNAYKQPGCIHYKNEDEILSCSHGSAPYYFAKSINDNEIITTQCNDIKDIITKSYLILKKIDDFSDNNLSSTCQRKARVETGVVFGEHVSREVVHDKENSTCFINNINAKKLLKKKMFIIIKLSALLLLINNNVALSFNPKDVICSIVTSNSEPVLFFLNTKKIKNVEIKTDVESIKKAPFTDRSDSLKIIIHGFGSSHQVPNIDILRKAYLNGTVDRNVLMVDYSKIIGNVSDSNIIDYGIDYIHAAKCHSSIVSKAVVNIINTILSSRSDIKKIHLIGHSLGGQISGEVGNMIQEKGNKIDRISALDPAEPFFKLSSRISAQSANFVDVYHTNIADKGFTKPIGTVDFYVNNGVIQPGCVNNKSKKESLECSHGAALLYFAKSINDDKIKSSQCNDIKEIVEKNTKVLFKIDDNNNNDLSNTCLQKSKLSVLNIFNMFKNNEIFGEHVSRKTSGVYFLSMLEIPSLD